MIIYLIPTRCRRTSARSRACADRDATIPEDQRAGCPSSVLSCTAWGFSCLANCSASGELLPRLFTLACALLPKNRRCLFCDTFRHRNFTTAAPACFTRHAAVWCSDFPPASRKRAHQRSSAIGAIIYHNRSEEENAEKRQSTPKRERPAISDADSKRRWHRHKRKS